jgi:hypothetical protein
MNDSSTANPQPPPTHLEGPAKPQIAIDKLVVGVVLLAVGVIAFGASIDLWNHFHWGRLWPLILIVIGLSGEVQAFRDRRGNGSAFLLAVGVWMLAGTHHLFGLTVRTAFPLGIVVLGVLLTLHAVVDLPRKEKNHGCNS